MCSLVLFWVLIESKKKDPLSLSCGLEVFLNPGGFLIITIIIICFGVFCGSLLKERKGWEKLHE